jgi:hypothetical protein
MSVLFVDAVRPLTVRILTKQLPLVADRRYEVSCESAGSRPPAIITWYKGKRPLRRVKVRPDAMKYKSASYVNANFTSTGCTPFLKRGSEYWIMTKNHYTGRKISVSLSYVTVRGEGKLERGKQDALCDIASPPSSYHGWLATNACICNGQRSSKIFCGTYTAVVEEMPPLLNSRRQSQDNIIIL